jgi:hypothetical protein
MLGNSSASELLAAYEGGLSPMVLVVCLIRILKFLKQ